jgi:hypothetical protein
MSEQKEQQNSSDGKITRRSALKAAMVAGGAAVLGFPMAEHLAAKGYLSRVRPRFCEENQRYDRR